MPVNDSEGALGKKFKPSFTLNDTATSGEAPGFRGHIVLNKFVLDDEGHICLTSPAGLHDMLDAINGLRQELDEMAQRVVLWVADNITLEYLNSGLAFHSDQVSGVGESSITHTGISARTLLQAQNVISLVRDTEEQRDSAEQ